MVFRINTPLQNITGVLSTIEGGNGFQGPTGPGSNIINVNNETIVLNATNTILNVEKAGLYIHPLMKKDPLPGPSSDMYVLSYDNEEYSVSYGFINESCFSNDLREKLNLPPRAIPEGYIQDYKVYEIMSGGTNLPVTYYNGNFYVSVPISSWSTNNCLASLNLAFERFGEDWVPSDVSRNWTGIALSSCGKYQTAVTSGVDGDIYVSNDFGKNWTARLQIYDWKDVQMSTSGQYQLALTNYNSGGYVYDSNDWGQTWIRREYRSYEGSPTPLIGVYSISISGNGECWYLITGEDSTFAYLRNVTNFGTTLYIAQNERPPFYNMMTAQFSSSQVSTSGNYVIVTVKDRNPQYSLLDRGIYMNNTYMGMCETRRDTMNRDKAYILSFNQILDLPLTWSLAVISGNGQYILACTTNVLVDGIYRHNNYGNFYSNVSNNVGAEPFNKLPWTRFTISGMTSNIKNMKISFTGQYQYILEENGYIYMSQDFGRSWNTLFSDTNRQWQAIGISTFGQVIGSVATNEPIQICVNPLLGQSTTIPVTTEHSSITLHSLYEEIVNLKKKIQ